MQISNNTSALIGRGTVSNAASLVVALSGQLERYELQLSSWQPASASDIQLTVSIDGGSTFIANAYQWSTLTVDTSSTTPTPTGASAVAPAAFVRLLANVPANVLGTNVTIDFPVPWDFSNYRQMLWRGGVRTQGGSAYANVTGHAAFENIAAAITHLKIAQSTGTISAGRWALYGF